MKKKVFHSKVFSILLKNSKIAQILSLKYDVKP